MKKLFVLVLISVLVFGCKKDIQEDPVANNEAEVSFQINLLDPGTTKDWPCKLDSEGNLLEPEYAEIDLYDGTTTYTFYPLVFRIGGVLYTQNIKLMLPPGVSVSTMQVTKFLLWDDGNTPTPIPDPAPYYGGTGDDEIVMGTPLSGSTYEVYITPAYRFAYQIGIEAFKKFEFPVEVLCYIDDYYLEFGFDWFSITEIVIREECFFGDICIKDVSTTTGYGMPGSPYLLQNNGQIDLDMPAIMKIYVKDANGDNVPFSPFTNLPDDGNGPYWVGGPLCINWPDNLQIDNEIFDIEIWIMVMDGDYNPPFAYNLFWTGTLSEEGVLYDAAGTEVPAGVDGIIEVVLGECNLSATDIQLVPYQNLPATCSMQTSSAYAPGPSGTYFDVTLSNLQTGPGPWDIAAGTYGVYCGDQDLTIYVPYSYPNTLVFGSLDPSVLPATLPAEFIAGLDEANWLMNNLDNYPTAQWNDIQWALWLLMDDNPLPDSYVPGPSTIANLMATDAGQYGSGFLPLPGGWAAVIFHAENPNSPGTYNVQVVFTFVDP